MMRRQDIPTVICFNKKDLVSPEELENLQKIYDETAAAVSCLPVRWREKIWSC